jgi:carboxyl-terminal processing protease
MRAYQAALWIVGVMLAALLLALVYTLGYVSNDGGGGSTTRAAEPADPPDGDGGSGFDYRTLDQIVDILKDDYFARENLDEQLLYEAAIRGLIDSLNDSGTFYIDAQTQRTAVGPSGSFEGIGATVSEQNGAIVIIRPFPGSPAEAAGILSGDIILAVDGESTEGWAVDEAVFRIRGDRGTQVTLTVQHLDGTSEDITITRDEVRVDSVTTEPPGGILRDASGNEVTDIGYIRISEFTQFTPQEVETAVSDAIENGSRALILDLRVNPGGLLDETVDTADLFLDEGVILIEVDRNDNESFYRARAGGAGVDVPLVVLLDEFSASGAEVLAAALKDNGRATIIGETSFGKGTVNVSQPLRDGGALFVTIRKWLTPAGVQIDGVGISPDIAVAPGPLDPDYNPLQDQQLLRAIDHLHGLQAAEQQAPASAAP